MAPKMVDRMRESGCYNESVMPESGTFTLFDESNRPDAVACQKVTLSILLVLSCQIVQVLLTFAPLL